MTMAQNSKIKLPAFFNIEGALLPPGAERFVRKDEPGMRYRINGWQNAYQVFYIEDYRRWPQHIFEGFAWIMLGKWRREMEVIHTDQPEKAGHDIGTVWSQITIWGKIITAAEGGEGSSNDE